MRILFLAPSAVAITLAACGSSTSSPGADAGTKHDAPESHDSATPSDGSSGHDTGMRADGPSGPPPTMYTTTCSPNIDVSKATNVMAPITTALGYAGCYVGTPPTTPTVVDSQAALSALFNVDAGQSCLNVLPTNVDYTTDRVVVFGGQGISADSLTVYQTTTGTIFDVAVTEFGAEPIGLVYLVVLPVALTTSITVMTCTTSCSGACPG